MFQVTSNDLVPDQAHSNVVPVNWNPTHDVGERPILIVKMRKGQARISKSYRIYILEL